MNQVKSSAHSPTFPSLHLRHNSFSSPSVTLPMSSLFSNPSVALPTSQLIPQPFRCFTYDTTHSPTLPSLYLRHSSAHSPTFPSLYLRHNSFSNPFVAIPTSQFILQPFCRFTYVTAHSPTLPLLLLRHSSFSNPSFASPTSQGLHLIHLARRAKSDWGKNTSILLNRCGGVVEPRIVCIFVCIFEVLGRVNISGHWCP